MSSEFSKEMRAIFTIALILVIHSCICRALDFNCNFTIKWYDFVGNNVYECSASLPLDTKNIAEVRSVSGTHLSGKTNLDVVALRINNQNLELFPINIEEFFPNLKVLQLYGNSISEVKNTHLTPFPNLVYLNLYTNKISSLDGNLLDGLPSLRYVSFERNRLTHVGHDLILPKDGLVFFDANPCINVRASTPDGIAALRFNLLINCTLIEPIEAALESRHNLLTDVSKQVQINVERLNMLYQSQYELKEELGNVIIHVNNEVQSITEQVTNLCDRLQFLTNEVNRAIGSFEQRLAKSDYTIESILASVKILLDKNVDLENRQKLCEERLQCLEMKSEPCKL